MDNRPIGVFDSGLGGLTVWKELKIGLPNESLYYYGDGKNCPYGDKSREDLIEYVSSAVERLLEEDVKMIVVACNAATSYTIGYIRERYSMIPIVGLEPAIKPAVFNTRSGVVGVLATAATLDGDIFRTTYSRYCDKVTILPVVGRGFVELVEENRESSPEARDIVDSIISPLIERGADEIVLGCTHYPFLRDVIQSVVGDRDVNVTDSSLAILRRVRQLLGDNCIAASDQNHAEYKFFTASNDEYLDRLRSKVDTFCL